MKSKSHLWIWTIGGLISLSLAAIPFPQRPARKTAPRASVRLASRTNPERSKLRAVQAYGRLPMAFEANQGQTEAEVKFLSRGSGYSVFLTPSEVVVGLRRNDGKSGLERQGSRARPFLAAASTGFGKAESPSESPALAVLRMKFPGANRRAPIVGLEELPGKSNYFIGNDPSQWRRNVPHYAQVRYRDLYPGIDLVYHGEQGQLEYDFVVQPGADPQTIRLVLEGAERLRVDSQGDLVSEAQDAEIRFRKPVIYQLGEGPSRPRNPSAGASGKQVIEGGYVLLSSKQESGNGNAAVPQSKMEVGFEIASYDASKPLVIDPVLAYSTYLGGNGQDYGGGIAVDNAGNTYVTGATNSLDFPTANPLQPMNRGDADAFVAKLDPTGSTLLYSTYLGGGAQEIGTAIAVDGAGNTYVTGSTGSTNFPTANPLQPSNNGGYDAFVASLDPTGSTLRYSTYLGGTAEDNGFWIAVDNVGNAYLTGYTGSIDFPQVNPQQSYYGGGVYDAFVAKLDPTGSTLLYSTYLGGFQKDFGYGIAVDNAGNAYVTGGTESDDFPTANPLQPAFGGGVRDAFVAKLDPTGSTLLYSTYLGGRGDDQARGLAVDGAGNAYVTGSTDSFDFPTANPFQPTLNRGGRDVGDAFVAKLDSTGSTLLFSTYFGGSEFDNGFGIAVDNAGNTYVTGSTESIDFPLANPVQPSNRGFFNAFVASFDTSGSTLRYSTYLGGSTADVGFGIAVDNAGNTYVTGRTNSLDFPTANPLQPAYGGGSGDAFVAKVSP